jgi:hypothetical protein
MLAIEDREGDVEDLKRAAFCFEIAMSLANDSLSNHLNSSTATTNNNNNNHASNKARFLNDIDSDDDDDGRARLDDDDDDSFGMPFCQFTIIIH